MSRRILEFGTIALFNMNGRASTEKSCALSWFQNWDESQRQEFAHTLLEKDKELTSRQDAPDESLNSLMQTLGESQTQN